LQQNSVFQQNGDKKAILIQSIFFIMYLIGAFDTVTWTLLHCRMWLFSSTGLLQQWCDFELCCDE